MNRENEIAIQNGQAHMKQVINHKLRMIDEHKEALVAAWVAETGLLPSESCMCVEHNGITQRIWIERLPTKEPSSET